MNEPIKRGNAEAIPMDHISAYDYARNIIDMCEEKGLGFILLGPSIDDVTRISIVSPSNKPGEILHALNEAVDNIKRFVD